MIFILYKWCIPPSKLNLIISIANQLSVVHNIMKEVQVNDEQTIQMCINAYTNIYI